MFTLAATPPFWRDRLQASGIHLCISACVALLVAILVIAVWYSFPHHEVSGGHELFLLVVGLDLVLGPLITFAVFGRKKPWTELRRDLAVVALLQLAALFCGLWTVFVARPMQMNFELDRFRVVHTIEVAPELPAKAPERLHKLSLTGPTLLAKRPFRDDNERMELTLGAVQEVHLSTRTDLWVPDDNARRQVLKEAKPLSSLMEKLPGRVATFERAAQETGSKPKAPGDLTLVGRNMDWTMLIEPFAWRIVNIMLIATY